MTQILDTVTAPTFVGPLTGNASTATALATPRTINGVSFDGTGNITLPGKILDVSFVPTDEGTTSTSHIDLTTPDEIGFTLDAETDCVFIWMANGYNDTNASGLIDQFEFDGVDDTATATSYTFDTANFGHAVTIICTKTLAAGAHTVKVQHRRLVGGTAHWRKRGLIGFVWS